MGRTLTQRVLVPAIGLALIFAGCAGGVTTPTAVPSIGGSPTAASAETSTSPPTTAPSTAVALEIPDPTLNLPCGVWSIDDARLACEGWDDTDPPDGALRVWVLVRPVQG